MSEPNYTRDELERRIAERLGKLDDDSLLRLGAISEYAEQRALPLPLPISGATEADTTPQGGLTRRAFLIGGVAVAGTALGGALVGTALVSGDALRQRALLALYEELEKTGLDALVLAGIAAVGAEAHHPGACHAHLRIANAAMLADAAAPVVVHHDPSTGGRLLLVNAFTAFGDNTAWFVAADERRLS